MKRNAIPSIHLFAALLASAVSVAGAPGDASSSHDPLEAALRRSYVYDKYLQQDAISTTCENGTATLSGQVNEVSHRDLAQAIVAVLPGVQRVDNRLTVALEGPETSDPWIRSKVRSALALQGSLNGTDIQVGVQLGVVTVQGVARSETQKATVTEYAGGGPGGRGGDERDDGGGVGRRTRLAYAGSRG